MQSRIPRWAMVFLLIAITSGCTNSDVQTLDLPTLAKKVQPAVLLMIVNDASGKEAQGTGFLISEDGKVITNYHVIENAGRITAKAENGAFLMVEGVIATDDKNDLAVLKLAGKNFPYLTLASNPKREVGTRVAVIGSPLGLEGSLSEGIISALREAPGGRQPIGSLNFLCFRAGGDAVRIRSCKKVGVCPKAEFGCKIPVYNAPRIEMQMF